MFVLFLFFSEIILLPNYRFFPFLGSVISMLLFLNTTTNLFNLPTLKEPKVNVTLFSRHCTLKKWSPRRGCPLVWFQHSSTKQVLSGVSSGGSRNPAGRAVSELDTLLSTCSRRRSGFLDTCGEKIHSWRSSDVKQSLPEIYGLIWFSRWGLRYWLVVLRN